MYEEIIQTNDGSYTLLHPEYKEPYHSQEGALTESTHLYINQSKFREALEEKSGSLNILDVGCGLGYNACSTLQAWMESSGRAPIHLVSLECNIELVKMLLSGEGLWQKQWNAAWIAFCQSLTLVKNNHWRVNLIHPSTKQHSVWEVFALDASEDPLPLPVDPPYWNYIWHDPFSYQHNPKLWDANWFTKLKLQSSSHTLLVTYSVARRVREALEKGGWSWNKIKGSQTKRNWLLASIPLE